MATDMIKAMTRKGTHGVGNLNSIDVKTVAHGAIVEGQAIDNFTLGELGFNENGERTVTSLKDVANSAILVASVERRYLGEELVDFYNDTGERVRPVILEEGYTRFDTSSFELDASADGKIEAGQVAHFDTAKKKFLLSDGEAPHVDYEGAKAKFLVVNSEDDLAYLCGVATVRLEVIEA